MSGHIKYTNCIRTGAKYVTWVWWISDILLERKVEDTTGVIRSCKSNTDKLVHFIHIVVMILTWRPTTIVNHLTMQLEGTGFWSNGGDPSERAKHQINDL